MSLFTRHPKRYTEGGGGWRVQEIGIVRLVLPLRLKASPCNPKNHAHDCVLQEIISRSQSVLAIASSRTPQIFDNFEAFARTLFFADITSKPVARVDLSAQ